MNEWQHEGSTVPFITAGRPAWASRPNIVGYRIELRTCGRLAESRHIWLRADGTLYYQDWTETRRSFFSDRLYPVPAEQPEGGYVQLDAGYWPDQTTIERWRASHVSRTEASR